MNWNRVRLLAIGLFVVAVGLRVLCFAVSVIHIPESADEAVTLLEAKRIAGGDLPLLFTAQPYLFPMESYLSAPLVRFLPRTALGATAVPVVLTALAFLATVWLCRLTFPGRCVWPAYLLILFPAPYCLMIQTGTAPPSYSAVSLFSMLALVAAVQYGNSGTRSAALPFATGLCAGLAVSSNLIAMGVLAMVGAFVVTAGGWRPALRATPLFAAGAFAGLVPHLLGVWLIPGAERAVTHTFSWKEALGRLWNPALNFTIPASLGIRTCLYPDNDETVSLVPGADPVIGAAWFALLLALTVCGAVRFAKRLWRERWPSLEVGDMFVGISWICLALFLANTRSNWHSYRYLLPAVRTFPFLVGALCERVRPRIRAAIVAVIVVLVTLNTATAAIMIGRWTAKEFPVNEADLFDVRPALSYLEGKGIGEGYASYWLAYRIDYETDERFICSQPFNERFFGWPIPYKDHVDACTNVAYILAPRLYLTPEEFESDMASMSVSARRKRFGDVVVYHGFAQHLQNEERRIGAGGVTMSAGDGRGAAAVLNDGIRTNWWRSTELQTNGMWIQASFAATGAVTRVSMFYDGYPYDQAAALTVLVWSDGRWTPACTDVAAGADAFEFKNNHPVYGSRLQTIRFAPVVTDRVRIEIARANAKHCWTVGEIELYLAADAANPYHAVP